MHASTVVSDLTDAVGFGDLGLAGLVTLTVIGLLTGKIIPLRQHREVIADRDFYRTALQKSEETRQMQARQIDELLVPLTDNIEHVLRSLPTSPQGGGSS